MLSHHELATLMVFSGGGQRLEPRDSDVRALCDYALVEVRRRDAHEPIMELTRRGRELLARLCIGTKPLA